MILGSPVVQPMVSRTARTSIRVAAVMCSEVFGRPRFLIGSPLFAIRIHSPNWRPEMP